MKNNKKISWGEGNLFLKKQVSLPPGPPSFPKTLIKKIYRKVRYGNGYEAGKEFENKFTSAKKQYY